MAPLPETPKNAKSTLAVGSQERSVHDLIAEQHVREQLGLVPRTAVQP